MLRERCKINLHPFLAENSFCDKLGIGITNCRKDAGLKQGKHFNQLNITISVVPNQRGLYFPLRISNSLCNDWVLLLLSGRDKGKGLSLALPAFAGE